MTEQPKTVRDIEWRVSTLYPGGYVKAEDQTLFMAYEYAQQVCEEHNEVGALRRQIKERDERIAELEKQLQYVEVDYAPASSEDTTN